MRAIGKAYFLFVIIILSLLFISPSSTASDSQDNSTPICNADRNETWTVGLIYCNSNMSPGYTLFSPISSTTTYLIDEHGREIHNWESVSGLIWVIMPLETSPLGVQQDISKEYHGMEN